MDMDEVLYGLGNVQDSIGRLGSDKVESDWRAGRVVVGDIAAPSNDRRAVAPRFGVG